jgi:glycosyltransferase involved in cell wall biosynthesis
MDTRTLAMTRATLRSRLRALFYRVMYACANRWADGQTVITPALAVAIGVPPAGLLGVWPSGVDLARFARAAPLRAWPGAGDAVELVYAGVFRPERNLLALSEAALLARGRGHRLRLTLLGDGPQRDALAAFAETTGGVVRLRARVPHAQMPTALAEAHVGVLPFPDLEIFRVSSFLKLMEYLAAGLPVVATTIAPHREILGRSDCAFWAEDASAEALAGAMGRACAARPRLAALGEEARRVARPFGWDAAARALESALTRLLDGELAEGAREAPTACGSS